MKSPAPSPGDPAPPAEPARPEPEPETPSRRHPRRGGHWPVEVRYDGGEVASSVADLSSGGAFVRDVTDLPHGSRATLVLSLGDAAVTVPAISRWVRHVRVTADLPAGTGFEFVDLDEAARHALAAELGRAP